MKKQSLAFLSAAILSTGTAIAQKAEPSIGLRLPTQKGSVMLGSDLLMGEMAFGSSDGEFSLSGSYNVSVHPRAAYFIKDNLAIGGLVSANFTGNTFNRYARYNSRSVGVGVFARQYFGKSLMKDGSMKRMRFFVEAGAGVHTGWQKFGNMQGGYEKGTFSGATFHLMPGFNYFLNKNVAFEGGLNYYHNAATGPSFGSPDHLGINLGLQFFLNRK